ncbi:MAG: wax ester/triacylglycerol synthase family O-acyltransferase, partial [Halieaceae bacterium]
MQKLAFQDSAFLRLESAQRPFHVAGLMVFKLPPDAPRGYLRKLARHCGRLNELWPIFNRKLSEPELSGNTGWVTDEDYDPARHVSHYALPPPGRMEDLLQLITAAHERPLDRGRPLWEIHIIEGLSGGRFAIYCKVHHALVDGVGALRMMDALFSTDPDASINFRKAKPLASEHQRKHSLLDNLGKLPDTLVQQYKAVPQLSRLLRTMGLDAFRGKSESMTLPFTAPRSLFNGEVDSRRLAVTCDLPLKRARKLAHAAGGTLNDVLLAVCGSALRRYLIDQNALPRRSLIAGVPVSLKRGGESAGNQLSFILCPFFTNEHDQVKRLNKVIRSTRQAKKELLSMSAMASQEFANMMLLPTIILTLSGNATRVNPAINAIFSNVPGSRKTLYLEGAELQSLYPLSVVTDGMGINLTVVSYVNKLCFAITACPTMQPGVEVL